jgi:uncharacterized membrane protein YbhN (UPF0104 family)
VGFLNLGRSSGITRERPGATVGRRRTVGRSFRRLLQSGLIGAVVAVAVLPQRRSLRSAAERAAHLSPLWLVVAFGAEAASLLAMAELQYQLLAGSGSRVNRRSLVAVSYAATALAAALPAGPAVASQYTYRSLLRRGSTAGAAGWVLAAAGVLSMVTLVLLGLIGAQLRGFGILCSTAGGIVGVSLLLASAATLGALVWSSRHRRQLEQLVGSVVARCHARWPRLAQRVSRRPSTRPAVLGRLGPPSGRGADGNDGALDSVRLGLALGLASVNWVADIAVLAIAFVALGLAVPWHGLLLAYAVSQLVTSVPILPGSIGVAEGSMAAALVCSGVRPGAAIAGVVVYRLVSFWLVLPAGWLAWWGLRRGEARNSRAYVPGDGRTWALPLSPDPTT